MLRLTPSSTLTDTLVPYTSLFRSERGEKVRAELPIKNVHRVVCTQVGSALTRKYGADGLPDDTIHLQFSGSAGQSLGAFVPRGITRSDEHTSELPSLIRNLYAVICLHNNKSTTHTYIQQAGT